MGFIHAGLQVDQVDGSNLLCMERAARRFIEIQSAVKRNPKHPDFMGLGFGTQTTLDESGAIRTGAYHEWLAEQQKVEGRLYKYGREAGRRPASRRSSRRWWSSPWRCEVLEERQERSWSRSGPG